MWHRRRQLSLWSTSASIGGTQEKRNARLMPGMSVPLRRNTHARHDCCSAAGRSVWSTSSESLLQAGQAAVLLHPASRAGQDARLRRPHPGDVARGEGVLHHLVEALRTVSPPPLLQHRPNNTDSTSQTTVWHSPGAL